MFRWTHRILSCDQQLQSTSFESIISPPLTMKRCGAPHIQKKKKKKKNTMK